jgi:hypothetical protein
MKNYFLFFCAMIIFQFISCSKKNVEDKTGQSIAGKWVLTKSCVCGLCNDSNSVDNNQTLVFSLDGKVQLSGSVGDAEQHYSGTYTVAQQAEGNVLNISLDNGGPANFLYVPGSVIYSGSATSLVLDLSTPFANACLYQNTYAAVPN